MVGQIWIQIAAVLVTIVWCGIGSFVLYKIVGHDPWPAGHAKKPSARASI